MNFINFVSKQLETVQQNKADQKDITDIQDDIDLQNNLDVSNNNTTSDEEQYFEEQMKEKPSFKVTYDEIHEKLKLNQPPQTDLENEQLHMIAELQAKLIVQETELLILKRIHTELKNKQTSQTHRLETLQKEKDVITQMKIGYDKKFQKLDEKRKIIDQNQRTIKKLALTTSDDYLESAIKRVNQQVKINDKVQILQEQQKKENPQIRKISNQKQNSFRIQKK